MLETSGQRSKKDYSLIGRLIMLTKPDEAAALLSAYNSKGIEKNIEEVPGYYKAFCRINGIDADSYRGMLNKKNKVEKRRFFISCILHLYCPEVYEQNSKMIIIPYGLSNALVNELQVSFTLISVVIREVIAYEKFYESYKNEATQMSERLYEYKNKAG